MSEEQDQNNSLIDESDNDSEPAVHHQMNPRVEAKINALCAQTGLIMKQVSWTFLWSIVLHLFWTYIISTLRLIEFSDKIFRKTVSGSTPIPSFRENLKRGPRYSLESCRAISLKTNCILFWLNTDRKFLPILLILLITVFTQFFINQHKSILIHVDNEWLPDVKQHGAPFFYSHKPWLTNLTRLFIFS